MSYHLRSATNPSVCKNYKASNCCTICERVPRQKFFVNGFLITCASAVFCCITFTVAAQKPRYRGAIFLLIDDAALALHFNWEKSLAYTFLEHHVVSQTKAWSAIFWRNVQWAWKWEARRKEVHEDHKKIVGISLDQGGSNLSKLDENDKATRLIANCGFDMVARVIQGIQSSPVGMTRLQQVRVIATTHRYQWKEFAFW